MPAPPDVMTYVAVQVISGGQATGEPPMLAIGTAANAYSLFLGVVVESCCAVAGSVIAP